MNGNPEVGLGKIKSGLESYRLTGSGRAIPQFCMMTAEAWLRAGRPDEALAALARGLTHAAENQEHVNEPELHRLTGEIHLMRSDTAKGEASLRRAIEIAQAQQAKMLELRAAISLAKLWRDQGKIAEACALLQPLDDWFQEGDDLPELCEARAILTQDVKMPGATRG